MCGVVASARRVKRDHVFGIIDCFAGLNGAEGVDFAVKVKGVFRLIHHLRGEIVGAVDQIQHLRSVEPSQSGLPGGHEQQIRVRCYHLCWKHAECPLVELPLFGVHQSVAMLGHQADCCRRVVS